ncbi:MAG: TonB-dependent receptor plug domain-containing protein [Bdellovibrionaceae bacterium]|nr:TonB-dependent receptor plug domain-containing protein [Pseudobdellovibrionaceae bacterium]
MTRFFAATFLLVFSSATFAEPSTGTEETVLGVIRVESASLIEQDIQQAPASISIITHEEIEKQTVSTVADVLRYADGVMLIGGTNRGVSLRGFDSSYALILVDGRRLTSRSLSVRQNDDADLSWISPQDIERIKDAAPDSVFCEWSFEAGSVGFETHRTQSAKTTS